MWIRCNNQKCKRVGDRKEGNLSAFDFKNVEQITCSKCGSKAQWIVKSRFLGQKIGPYIVKRISCIDDKFYGRMRHIKLCLLEDSNKNQFIWLPYWIQNRKGKMSYGQYASFIKLGDMKKLLKEIEK